MRIGDYVEKKIGFGSEMKDYSGKSGLVVYVEPFIGKGSSLRRAEVMTGQGEIEFWITKFCEVIFASWRPC